MEPQAEGGLRGDARGWKSSRRDSRRRLRRCRRGQGARARRRRRRRSSTGTTTTPSSRCSTSSRRGLLETTAVGHSLRDLLHGQKNARVHQASVTAIDLDARRISFDDLEPLEYDYLVLGLGAEVNFFGTEGAAEHAFPMYTLPDAVRLKDHLLERWEAADRHPELIDDGALNVVIVGGGPTGVETAGALAELYRAELARDYRRHPAGSGARDPRRGGADAVLDVQAEPPRLRARGTREADRRGEDGRRRCSRSRRRASRCRSGEELKAHTLVWGAGLRGNELVRSLGLELERGDRIGGRARARRPRPARSSSPWRHRVRSRTRRPTQVLPQLGSVALQSGEHAGKTIARRLAGKQTKPFAYKDKGTMAAIGRGAAVVQFLRRPHDEGREGTGRVGHGAPRAAADERGPRQGGRRLGRAPLHAPACRPDHGRHERSSRRDERASASDPHADVLVIFGITGDLAKVMTFRSLYRLERRGLLDCPIVGVAVDDWTRRPARRARARLDRRDGRAARRGGVRPLRRHGSRTSRATSRDAATLRARRRGDRRASSSRSSTSRSRRSCSAASSRGSHDAGLTDERARRRREAVRPRPRVGRRARRRAAPVHRRVAALPDRPLPREDGPRGDPPPALRELDARAGLEPELHRVRRRSRWPRTSASRTAATSTTRSARCATSSSTT